MSAYSLPLKIEDINAAWLTSALQAFADDVEIRGFEIVDVVHGTCTKIRIKFDINEAGQRAGIPGRVMLKGGFEPHSRDLGFMHEAEVRGYRDVFPHLRLRTPRAYFASYEPEHRQGIVIMEDLRERGATFCHALVPNSADSVARRLTELARFHAASWGSAEFAVGGRWDWVRDTLPDGFGHFDQFLKPDIWNRYVALPRGAAASVAFHDLAWMRNALSALVRLGRSIPSVLQHGDTHLGNLYVDRDGTPGFFDSLPHKGAAIQEVAYHIGAALDPIVRRSEEQRLLAHYVENLKGFGVGDLGLHEANRQYRAFLAFGYFIFMINESLFQPEAINTAYTARFSAAMIDNETADVLARL